MAATIAKTLGNAVDIKPLVTSVFHLWLGREARQTSLNPGTEKRSVYQRSVDHPHSLRSLRRPRGWLKHAPSRSHQNKRRSVPGTVSGQRIFVWQRWSRPSRGVRMSTDHRALDLFTTAIRQEHDLSAS